jgi:hypothetical protein
MPHHLIAVIKNMYKGIKVRLITNSGKMLSTEINLGVRQGCSMSPILFNIYLDDAVSHWQSQLKIQHISDNFKKENFIKTSMFADDQVIISDNGDTLQRALHELNKIILDYNFEISIHKTKNMVFCGKRPVRSKLILDNQPTEQVSKFNYLGC